MAVVVQRLHPGELDLDAALVRRLLAAQFPDWAELPLERVRSTGTDNAIFRLGHELAVRLPRTASAAARPGKEIEWLPRLAPHLPLEVPTPIAAGEPGDGYPWRWSVCTWLAGEAAATAQIDDLDAAARGLAGFVRALQRIDATGAPAPGEHNAFRGVPLAVRDRAVRRALPRQPRDVDVGAATAAWERALAAPAWGGPSVWLHGDLLGGNVLVRNGRICAVIDFGCLGAGDPACELLPAWTFLSGARATFHASLTVDDATWARGRGWALSWALIALPYYLDTNPPFAADARAAIDEVLADR